MTAYTAPAANAAAVTPSDSTIIDARGLYVGTGGTVVVDMFGTATAPGATVVTFTNVPSGSILPISVRRVRAATTASGIVALY